MLIINQDDIKPGATGHIGNIPVVFETPVLTDKSAPPQVNSPRRTEVIRELGKEISHRVEQARLTREAEEVQLLEERQARIAESRA